MDWSVRLLITVNKLDFTNQPYYYYRQSREGSISTTVSQKHLIDITDSIKSSVELVDKSNVVRKRKDTILNFLAYQYIVLMAYYVEADTKELKTKVKSLYFLLKIYNKFSIKESDFIAILKIPVFL